MIEKINYFITKSRFIWKNKYFTQNSYDNFHIIRFAGAALCVIQPVEGSIRRG